jgi:hypothetical protein
MTDVAIAETPEAAEQVLEVTDSPMSFEELTAQAEARKNERLGITPEAEAPEAEDPEPGEPEVESEDEEAEEETEEGESDDDDVLSQFDVEKLNDDQKAELAQLLGSGAGKTIGKQRKEIRELSNKLKAAEDATKEALALAPASDNPYSNIHKAEEVDSKLEQAQVNVDFWDAKLDQAIDDEAYEVEHNGQSISTKQIRAYVKDQRAQVKQLKSRQSEINKVQSLFETEDEKIETLRLELGMEEDGEASKAYESYLSDPSFQLVKNVAPDFALKLIETFAHAAVGKNQKPAKVAPKKRNAPRAKKAGGIPKAGGSTPSNQNQLSALEKIATDPKKDIATRRNAAAQLRQLKSTLR